MKSIQEFVQMKQHGQKITMVTCYDAWAASLCAQTDVDMLLVGDSVAMVVHGHDTTLPASMEMMVLHTEAVVRGKPGKFVVADMPFLANRKGLADTVENAGRLMKAGAHAIKLEGARGNLELVQHLVQSGIPVMGHLGLTPQSIHQLGGFKVQAKEAVAQKKLIEDALALEEAGCFSLVLECVPSRIAQEVSQKLKIPTIGIGAGPACDGQVLVMHDLLGFNDKFKPKFLRHFGKGVEFFKTAVQAYVGEVHKGTYPGPQESYE